MVSPPPINLDPKATPWAKWAQTEISGLQDQARRNQQTQGNSGRAGSSTLALLSGKVQDLQKLTADLATAQSKLETTTTNLKSVTDLLSAVANVQYSEWNSGTGSTGAVGWRTAPASVTITSPSGRLEVGFGGSLNSGNGTFCYQIVGASSGTVVSRDSVRGNLAQRAALAGGASFTPSIFNTVIVNVPANEPLTVSVHMYSDSASTYFFGARILARVAP